MQAESRSNGSWLQVRAGSGLVLDEGAGVFEKPLIEDIRLHGASINIAFFEYEAGLFMDLFMGCGVAERFRPKPHIFEPGRAFAFWDNTIRLRRYVSLHLIRQCAPCCRCEVEINNAVGVGSDFEASMSASVDVGVSLLGGISTDSDLSFNIDTQYTRDYLMSWDMVTADVEIFVRPLLRAGFYGSADPGDPFTFAEGFVSAKAYLAGPLTFSASGLAPIEPKPWGNGTCRETHNLRWETSFGIKGAEWG